MSSSEDEERSLASSVVSQHGGDEDFPNEQPRKRVRLSSSDEDALMERKQEGIEPVLSRVKARKNGVAHVAAPVLAEEHVTSQVTVPTERTTFAKLSVKPWLVASLANMAITRPTAIQKESIPEILKGRDCIGGSRTGSGKTVAFAVPMLQKWAEDREYRVQVVGSKIC
jgi:ATP-dependent RNA helicase DDX49/DBP8